MKLHLLGESVSWPKEQSFRVGHYHSLVTRRRNKFIKMRLNQLKYFISRNISFDAWGNYSILYHKAKAAEEREHSTTFRVFPYTSFVLYRFLRALYQNRAQSRLLYLLINRLGRKTLKVLLFPLWLIPIKSGFRLTSLLRI